MDLKKTNEEKATKQGTALFSTDACRILFDFFAGTFNAEHLEFHETAFGKKRSTERIDLWTSLGVLSLQKIGRRKEYFVNTEPLVDCFCEGIVEPVNVDYQYLSVNSKYIKDKVFLKLCSLEESHKVSTVNEIVCKNPQFRSLVNLFIEETFPLVACPGQVPVIGPDEHNSLYEITCDFVEDIGSFLSKDECTFRKAVYKMQHETDPNVKDYAWLLVALTYIHRFTVRPFELSPEFKTEIGEKLHSTRVRKTRRTKR